MRDTEAQDRDSHYLKVAVDVVSGPGKGFEATEEAKRATTASHAHVTLGLSQRRGLLVR